MNRDISILLKIITSLNIVQMMFLANACLSTQLQDFRPSASPKGNCIEIQDCNGVIIQEIKVCYSPTCPIGAIEQPTQYSYSICICPYDRISSDFQICSDACPGSQIPQQDTKLCLASIDECGLYLTQDKSMCGQNICVQNQYINMINGLKVCTCQIDMKYFDLKTKYCMSTCPADQEYDIINNICLLEKNPYCLILSSNQQACGQEYNDVCKKNEIVQWKTSSLEICVPCPEDNPIPNPALSDCWSCSPNISDLTTWSCLENPSQCTGLGTISSDGKRCSYTCKLGEYISKETDYLQCRVMQECPLVDIRVSPNVCLYSFEDCIGGFISIDKRFCLDTCPYEQQISTETVLIQNQGFTYKKCVAKMSDIVLISVGFALLATLISFLFCQAIIAVKIAKQEKKYLRIVFPATTEYKNAAF